MFSKQGSHNRYVIKLDEAAEELFVLISVPNCFTIKLKIIKIYLCRKKARRDRAIWLYKRGEIDRLRKYYRSFYKQFIKKKMRKRHRRRGRRSPMEVSECRSCGLLLVADPSFYQNVGERSVKQTVLQMLYHVREANLLLRHQDYDRDGYPDCVGVHVSGVGVLTSSKSDHNLLTGHFNSSEEYLRAFSKYQFDQHCLAVLFSSKVFAGKVLGLSWKGDTQKAGGICQNRVNVGSAEAPEMYNLNSLFITLRTRNTKRIPLRMGVLNLAHELLHSFGASHDPHHCSPENIRTDGRYLMSKFSSSGVKRNNELISNCTAKSVSRSLLHYVSLSFLIKCSLEMITFIIRTCPTV